MPVTYSVFATVGNATQPFDRMVQMVDEAARAAGKPTLIQTGSSTIRPAYADAAAFLTREEFEARVDEAACVITHGGVGSIAAVLQKGKIPLVIARRKHLSEVINDHQLELISEFGKHGLVVHIETAEQLTTHLSSEAHSPGPRRQHYGQGVLRIQSCVSAFLARS
jgi:UDP-N-acetylglucosamine transferase subunit ALG13